MDLNHQVHLIAILKNPDRGVLIEHQWEGKWAFVSTNLPAGEDWQDILLEEIRSETGITDGRFKRVLEMKSFPAGTVAEHAKFGVFCLFQTDQTGTFDKKSHVWIQTPQDLKKYQLMHPDVETFVLEVL